MATGTATRTTPVMPSGTWKVEAAHSSVTFSVKTWALRTCAASSPRFEGGLEIRENLAEGRIYGTVKAASIDTGEAPRDEHLRSADFFDAEQFPEITFESTRVEAIDDLMTRVTGNLTMHGVTHEIVLEGVHPGHRHRPVGNTRAGVEAVGQLLRSDFDMKVNQALGSGNKLVGDKVAIALGVSAVLQAS